MSPGDEVVSGTVLVDGALTVRVERAGDDTTLQRMAADLRSAADRPVRLTTTDRIAPWFTGATLVAATLTAGGWLLAGDASTALSACVAVLVVACPCALALSRPLSAAAGLGVAARRGQMFRSADGLLDLVEIDVVGLDKTGVVRLGLEIGAPLELIWSCYREGPAHCWKCPSCLRLKRAFERNGAFDPAQFSGGNET